MGGPPSQDDGYVLYIFPFSLYSIMVRLTASLGELAEGSAPAIEKKLVDLHREENITEWYLTSINPKGQVPVLAGGVLAAPLAESLEISMWLCRQHFGRLLPEKFREPIETLLAKLHAISGMSLSFKEVPDDFPEGIPIDSVDRLLAQDDISPEYRAGLEQKKRHHESKMRWTGKPDAVQQAKAQARELLDEVLGQYEQHNAGGGMWIFGDQVGPTLLDAHVVPLIARIIDTKQDSLVPEKLLSYARKVMESAAYQSVTHGRRTMWDISYGHTRLLKDI